MGVSRRLVLFVIITLIAILPGCANKPSQSGDTTAGTEYMSITDDGGRTVKLEHKPARTVVLSPSFLDILYTVDGTAVGRPSTKNLDVPAAARQVAEVGYVYNINMEKVVALGPDLVIAFQGMHEKLVPLLESNHIPVILVKLKTYQDVLDKVRLFSAIAGTKDKGEQIARQLEAEVRATTDKIPDKPVKVAILHATAKSVTVELENSIAGNVAKILKLSNIAEGSLPLEGDPDNTPFSLEKLVESDPDIIFVTTMGKDPEIEKRMQTDVKSNPAWAGVKAVRNQKVYYLPQDLFLLNPGLKYPEAVEYMASIAYPEVFGHEQ
ncbi:hypothetical protein P22_0714 [Propionispora sp. 2/2-37]|uniref:ABC transporter substrate-binding protein n=1 Tax=Propionispora sp. 2/2-37 TaxID=1677858 RepID=UPI0006BB8C38|nr:ABC transporter substrate-binding protein [Propionispora sp. 2/2-37]CUH94648.1 hypothetical protein P22_0714 [Propionispora sp. 2/2-37]